MGLVKVSRLEAPGVVFEGSFGVWLDSNVLIKHSKGEVLLHVDRIEGSGDDPVVAFCTVVEQTGKVPVVRKAS